MQSTSTSYNYRGLLDTTEILRTIKAKAWEYVSSLPFSASNLRGATLSNTVFMIGKYRSLYSE